MINAIIFENIFAIGTARRGKYTLPNIGALSTNVLDVLVNTAEKYVQRIVPDI